MEKLKQIKSCCTTPIIVIVVLLICGIYFYYYNFTRNNPPEKDLPAIKTEEQQAQGSLEQFFSLLNQEKYGEALIFFEPKDGWGDMGLFVEEYQRNDKIAIISRYCEAVQTCLNVKVLEVKKLADSDYLFKVNFIKDDGGIFVAGPCCGETEETSPSVKEFDYEVKNINGAYKVITPPLYRP